jgi:hypothetical protein
MGDLVGVLEQQAQRIAQFLNSHGTTFVAELVMFANTCVALRAALSQTVEELEIRNDLWGLAGFRIYGLAGTLLFVSSVIFQQ